MWRRVAFPLSLTAAVTAAALAASSLSAAPVVPEQPAAGFPGGPHYAIGCSISHQNNDDPIVRAGQGARTITRSSETRRSTPGRRPRRFSADRPAAQTFDSSGYWFPSLFVNDRSVLPRFATVFYVKRSRENSAVARGLVMIASNAAARSAQPKSIVAWRLPGRRRTEGFSCRRAAWVGGSSSGSRSRVAGTVDPEQRRPQETHEVPVTRPLPGIASDRASH